MAHLVEKFWNKHLNDLDESIETYSKSLYTWAVLLNKCITDRERWVADKKDLFNNKKDLLNTNKDLLHNKDLLNITNVVIDHYMNIVQKPKNKPNLFDEYQVDDVNVEVDDVNVDVNVEVEEETQNIDVMSNVLLEQHANEQKELDKVIEEKRRILKEQNLSDAPKKEIKFYLSSVGENTPNDTEQKGVIVQPVEVFDQLLNSTTVNETTVNETTINNTTLVGETYKPSIPIELERKAPTINALLRLSLNKREELEANIFLQAKKNVKQMLPKETNNDVLEPLYFKEADRLLKLYMDTH